MTSQLWLWCVCSWVAAGGPPGSALQLAPGMPNVCEEQQLAVVRLARPCVQAFTHTVKLWKQGCTGLRWCVAYERRTKYYSVHRQAYSTERQTVYKCCPGWSQRYAEQAACTVPISAVGTHLDGERCSDGEAQWCQCSEGFHGPSCQYDINKCTIGNGGCEDQCCNTVGSYYCRCQAGQKLKEDGKGCEDVDECVVVNGGCQQRCINTLGTFHCECDTGYRLHADERTCININECAEGLARCGHRCVNRMGSFTCACHPGFELGADGKQCYRIELEIVNSCVKNNGGCSHHCEHAITGPRCSCNHGHQLDSDEKTCIDLDECESGEACCAQLCINYLGGYECNCKEGFRLSLDGCGCDDVNECLDVGIVCDQLCINSMGTYSCTCEEGYRIGSDRKTCIILDDDELKKEEEELEVVRFPGLLLRRPPQLLRSIAPSLPSTLEGEERQAEEEKDRREELTALLKVGE
ncbi:EGF-like and EMI domain-containing protein 1 [Dasypus novemcinctus]|uniref:EGF-like and EMI domain-containing protein 1 n=1 Tax=Dasypus novemcinctus TaxID=9361 RepID=UPI0039C9E6BB